MEAEQMIDHGIKYSKYEKFIEQSMDDRMKHGRPNTPSALIIELMGEMGEAINAIKHAKIWRPDVGAEGQRELDEHVVDELGDTFFYFVALLKSMNITLEEIMEFNENKIRERYGMYREGDPRLAEESLD